MSEILVSMKKQKFSNWKSQLETQEKFTTVLLIYCSITSPHYKFFYFTKKSFLVHLTSTFFGSYYLLQSCINCTALKIKINEGVVWSNYV